MEKVAVIGSGFSSLSAACYMAQAGCDVVLVEKNESLGGRARQFEREGFKFDMGPTFYWMPDIFEKFFADFRKTPDDYYSLFRLNPGYEIYYKDGTRIKQSSEYSELKQTFEEVEAGSSRFLDRFLREAAYNYRVAIDKVVYKPGKSIFELIMPETIRRSPQFLQSLSYTVRRGVQDAKLRQMLEFPVLFLGAKPDKTPSFYRFMNYADIMLGSWHVKGGMMEVINGMKNLAESLGVEIRHSHPVSRIITDTRRVKGVVTNGKFMEADAVISGADYAHTETLIPERYRNYAPAYWEKKLFAPSAILYYIAFDKKIQNVSHHTLFFDTSFKEHASKIYDTPGWPEKPMFYASFPSQTDAGLCPAGKEVCIILIPSAAGLPDTAEIRERYFDQVLTRMERLTGQELKPHVQFYDSYAASDFIRDYHAYKGNAYGLANTLMQTAVFKPKVYNWRLPNLFYTGQLTVPGPGVPTAIISGKIAANCAIDYIKSMHKSRM